MNLSWFRQASAHLFSPTRKWSASTFTLVLLTIVGSTVAAIPIPFRASDNALAAGNNFSRLSGDGSIDTFKTLANPCQWCLGQLFGMNMWPPSQSICTHPAFLNRGNRSQRKSHCSLAPSPAWPTSNLVPANGVIFSTKTSAWFASDNTCRRVLRNSISFNSCSSAFNFACAAYASASAIFRPASTLYRSSSSSAANSAAFCNRITTYVETPTAAAANAPNIDEATNTLFQKSRSNPSIRLTLFEKVAFSIIGASCVVLLVVFILSIRNVWRAWNAIRGE
jgi:hypothetical protein